MSRFIDRLDDAARANRSLLGLNLDPWGPSMPVDDIAAFNRAIIDATHDLVCVYKPNSAFYEAAGLDGLRALQDTVEAAHAKNIPVILDAKRGDIANSSVAYAKAAFEVWGADALTVSPYMGGDSLEPFLAYEDRGVFVLTRTSNPGAADIEELIVQSPGGPRPLYEQVAIAAAGWNTRGNVGLVVGATAPDELARVRGLAPAMPILVPGVGAQGGDLAASVRNGVDANGRRVVIAVGRQVLYASKGAGYAQAARAEAERLREAINAELDAMGVGWS
ncbi:MAG: orotidine-5'-phosphate decarboxylase [Chloroflexi bacterium]|nr:orotidine-5'-phosphate decarboxylase [Chloroflexota bacterium]